MSILINTLLDRVQREFSLPEVVWENTDVNQKDLKFLRDECNKDSEFDPINKRKMMFDGMMNGNLYTMVSKCEYGQVMAVFETMEQMAELPWGLWGRILRLFSEPFRKPFKIFFLGNKSLRQFPGGDEPISPENINGGYTYRCDPETIVIYRAEDATRVLIHELQHSCCLDNPENGIDIVEAETEAWAELFYVAILSQGRKYMFKDLLQRQSEWMIKQNRKVRRHMKNPDSPILVEKGQPDGMEFPWRYTIGKEEVWERWGILRRDEMKPVINVGNSLRLTNPPTTTLKDRFKVIRESTIL
jgi:hypothetical protein